MDEIVKEKIDGNELLWNSDLIEAIQFQLQAEFSNFKVIKGKILKDIFLSTEKNQNQVLQFGFVDQDIVIYKDTMDISDLKSSKQFSIHKNTKNNSTELIIPKIIIELKFDGITSHGLIIYSDYAAQIKSIFPECKYFLAMKFNKSSTPNKLMRHGRNFDKMIYFSNGKSTGKYVKGSFLEELRSDKKLKLIFDEFIEEIKKVLEVRETFFVK